MLASGHAGDLVGQMHLEKVSNTVGYAVQDFVLLDIADRIGIPKDDKEGAFTDVARYVLHTCSKYTNCVNTVKL